MKTKRNWRFNCSCKHTNGGIMSYREIEDKLQLILPFVFLIVMFYVVSQGSRFEYTGLSYDQRMKLEEAP